MLAIAALAHAPRTNPEPPTWSWGKDHALPGLGKCMAVYRHVLRQLKIAHVNHKEFADIMASLKEAGLVSFSPKKGGNAPHRTAPSPFTSLPSHHLLDSPGNKLTVTVTFDDVEFALSEKAFFRDQLFNNSKLVDHVRGVCVL